MRRWVWKGVAMLATCAVALVVASGALAGQAPLQRPSAYVGQAGEVQSQVQQPRVKTLGQLPFTGLELATGVGVALILVVTGSALRRRASRRS